MKTINIVNFYAGDMKSVSEGGIASYVKEILKQSNDRITYSLAGVTKNFQNKIGEWSTGVFENTKFNFFPVLSVNDNHITYEKGIPLNLRYLFNLFKYRSKILKKADSLHFHRVELALPFVFKKNKPVVVTINGNNYDIKIATKHPLFKRKWFRYFFHKLEKFIISRIDKVIFVSYDGLDCYSSKLKNLRDKFVFLPNFIDLNLFLPMNKNKCLDKFNLDKNKKIILFAGRLHEQKGLDLLLDAYSLLRKHSRNEFLSVLAGEGVERKHLEKKAIEENLKDVIFLGNIPHALLPELMNCADVFVLPSIWEGMPYVVLEALACGVPVVATAVGQISHIIKDGINGFIINNRDALELKEKIIQAVNLDKDIKNRCRDSAKDFSSPLIINEIAEIHKTFLDNIQKNENRF